MNSKYNTRRGEFYLVSAPNQTTLKTADPLYDTTTGAVNLNEGQIGILNVSTFGSTAFNTFTDATPTVSESPEIQIVQGTADSANPSALSTYPLWSRPFEASPVIDFRNQVVEVTHQQHRVGKLNTWVLGAPSASTSGQINTKNDTIYGLNIAYRGAHIQYQYSMEQAAALTVTVTSPDNLTTFTKPINWLVYNLGYEINRNSQYFNQGSRFQGTDPVMAFAVSDEASGGTAISSINVGDQVPVWIYKGVTRTVKVTRELLASLTSAATATGFTRIHTINLANAATDPATGLLIVGLDYIPAFRDYAIPRRTMLRVGAHRGFNVNTVQLKNVVAGDEGQGYGRQLNQRYLDTHGQRKYAQRHTLDPIAEFPSPFNVNTDYDVFAVHSITKFASPITSLDLQPFVTYVAIPSKDNSNNDNALITAFTNAMNSILGSAGLPNVKQI